MIRWVKRHSLSLALVGGGLTICGLSIPLKEGTWFDLVSQTGGGLMVAGLVYFLSGPLRETNRPEAPPDESGSKKTPPRR